MLPQDITIGQTGDQEAITLTPEQRSTHMHVLGATGQGKSKFLEQMIRQDIQHRHGLCLIDPHGTLYEEIVAWCADHGLHRLRRIHLIDPNSDMWTVGFDPLRCPDKDYLSVTVDAAVEACAQVWGGEDSSRTPLLKKCLRAVFYALVAQDQSFGDAMKLTTVSDLEGWRARLSSGLPNAVFQAVWDDLNSLSRREFVETFASTNNRLIEFLSNPQIQQMLQLREHSLDLAACMEQGDIVLVNLQPRRISNDNARLIGTLLTNVLFNTAIRRAMPPRGRPPRPFYLYIDECYRFLTKDVEGMLDQTRKFGLHVVLAHQHLGQLSAYGEAIFNAVMTNARTKVVFGGLSDSDGERLAKELLRELFDYNRPKPILDKPVVTGFETITLHGKSRSIGESVTEGESSFAGSATGEVAGLGTSQLYGVDGLPISPVFTGSSSSSQSSSVSSGQGRMKASSRSFSVWESQAEALRPILEYLPTALEGSDEILHRAILTIRKQPKRSFILVQPDAMPLRAFTPLLDIPQVGQKRLTRFGEQSRAASPYICRREEAEALIAARHAASMEPVVDDGDGDPFSVPET